MISQRRVPVITLIFIAANVIAAFMLLFYPDLAFDFGFRSNRPGLQTVFTSLFLHANVLHLLGNMIFLAAVGAAVEIATGSLRFGSVYLISGVTGVGCHYLATRHLLEPAPLIGASGCIAGCAGYYCVRYPGLKVAVGPSMSLSVAVITAIWFVLQVVGGVVHLGDPVGQTSFWAHIGGFGAGLILCVAYRAPDMGQLKLRHEVLASMNLRGPAAVAAAAKKHLLTHPTDVVALRELARAYAQMDESAAEAETILRLMDFEPLSEQAALLGRLIDIGQAGGYSSGKRTMLAEKFKSTHPSLSRALLLSVLEDPQEDPYRPEAMLALVSLERITEPVRAEQMLQELLAEYPMHPCTDLARKRGWVQ